MRGKQKVVVKSARVQYKFTLERNITILRGNSATGKTTLIDMILSFQLTGKDSGVEIRCDKPCVVLTGINWKLNLSTIKDSIVFIDEGDAFVKSKEFAHEIKNTDNYYVIATRTALISLPYSVNEIYGIKNVSGNRYRGTKRIYNTFYPLNDVNLNRIDKPDYVVVEDSNSGFDFFSNVCKQYGIPCVSALGNSNLTRKIKEISAGTILVIADGAAFGPYIDLLISLRKGRNIIIYLPESFEWLILNSGIILNVSHILESPSDYIDSQFYFNWEQFFTDLLVLSTKDSPYLQYTKSKLNNVYLHDRNKTRILSSMPEMNWDEE